LKFFILAASALLFTFPQAAAQPRAPGAAPPREGYVRTADGVRLFYRVVGAGRETLVAVHGGPGNSFNSILPDLEPLAKNRTVIYYDQRGNGRSDLLKDADSLKVSRHVEDLETIRRHFGLEKMSLLGNSWGGLLISLYAAAHPDRVERLVLHSAAEPTIGLMREFAGLIGGRIAPARRERFRVVSNPRYWVESKDPRAVCREFFSIILPAYLSKPERASRFRGDVCSGSEEAVRYQQHVNMQIWRSLGEWDVLPSLAAVKAPVLVIHGRTDPIPLASSEAWAKGYPNARLLLFEDSGHLPHVEEPELFFPAVETFLKGDWPRQAKKP
jgi:proline iminopeptidase